MQLTLAIIATFGIKIALTQTVSCDGPRDPDPTPPSSCPKTCPYDLSNVDHSHDTPSATDTWWKPTATPNPPSWQIVLNGKEGAAIDMSRDVYDFDLFDNQAAIKAVKAANSTKKVMCYFSAGTWESWRCDSSCFPKSDLGGIMCDWPGERWVKPGSQTIRDIMLKRLDLAKSVGCDGVDPDNIDAFDNEDENTLGLTRDDAISYINFLADAAHARGMSCGLKNSADIAEDTISKVDYQVNEECVAQKNCGDFQVYIKNNKPVFNIEYPYSGGEASSKAWTTSEMTSRCTTAASSAKGFSVLLKNLSLNDWSATCPITSSTPPDINPNKRSIAVPFAS